jgi:hypothetical protein
MYKNMNGHLPVEMDLARLPNLASSPIAGILLLWCFVELGRYPSSFGRKSPYRALIFRLIVGCFIIMSKVIWESRDDLSGGW